MTILMASVGTYRHVRQPTLDLGSRREGPEPAPEPAREAASEAIPASTAWCMTGGA